MFYFIIGKFRVCLKVVGCFSWVFKEGLRRWLKMVCVFLVFEFRKLERVVERVLVGLMWGLYRGVRSGVVSS